MSRAILMVALLLAVRASGEEADPLHQANKALVEKAYVENVARYKGDADYMVRRGLVANRKDKTVAIQAEATLVSKGEPVEFLLIAEDSGHGYEALSLSFAKPGDVHDALVFIGMAPGVPYSPKRLRFWPKGERVTMRFDQGAAGGPAPWVRVEKLLVDDRTGQALPEAGLVFTGSQTVNPPATPEKRVYAADVYEPKSIASDYNEPTTVLDVPHQAEQSAVYRHQSVNPEFLLPTNRLLTVLIEPEFKDGRKRVANVRLEARAGTAAAPLCDLKVEDGSALLAGAGLDATVARLRAFKARQQDPFATLKLDPKLRLDAVAALCAALVELEGEEAVRMEPPLPGDLYFRAFVPNPVFRDRNERIAQPWELRLSVKDGAIQAVLTQIEQLWKETEVRPELKITNHAIPTPPSLKEALGRLGPGLAVILVFADPSVTQGQLMEYIGPVLETHSTIHVFVEAD